MENELPKGWSEVKLGDVFKTTSGGTPSRTNREYYKGTIPWVKSGELNYNFISDTEEKISQEAIKNSSAKIFPKGTLLIALYGATIGKLAMLNIGAATNQAICGIFENKNNDIRFLYWYLFFKRQDLIEAGAGGAQPNISQTLLKDLQIPLPPLTEQKRIVAKLDVILTRINNCKTRLEKIPALLKSFRQSVLAAAVRGELTKEWREKNTSHTNPNTKQIHDSPFELPSTWEWIENKKLSSKESNSIGAGPFGTIFKARDFRGQGIPIVFLRHIGEGKYLTHKPAFMDKDKWHQLFKSYSVFGEELLITKLGDPPGTCTIYPTGLGPAMVTPDVIRMTVNNERVINKYLMYFFNSPVSKEIMFGLAFGVTRLRIDLPMFKNLLVPLPPLEEQKEIVRKVEELFAYADTIEARYQKAKAWVDKLTQSILAKAFRGELVPQNENDEPASVLLQKIQQEKQNNIQPNQKQKPKLLKSKSFIRKMIK